MWRNWLQQRVTLGERGTTLFQARVSLASSKRDFFPARTLKLLMTMSKFR